MNIYFIRHGMPDYKIDSLTELGKYQADHTSDYLKNIPFDIHNFLTLVDLTDYAVIITIKFIDRISNAEDRPYRVFLFIRITTTIR